MSETDTHEAQQEVQQKVTRAFRDNVLRWVEIDDDIRSIRAKVKELNDEKKQFEEQIISYLNKVDEESIIIKDGKLSKTVSKSQAPLKKETIQKSVKKPIKKVKDNSEDENKEEIVRTIDLLTKILDIECYISFKYEISY